LNNYFKFFKNNHFSSTITAKEKYTHQKNEISMNTLKLAKILYVEDEENTRKNAVEYLEYYCDNVYEAENGEEGYQTYLNIKPDIIITDINMPKLNGLEMIQRIRENDNKTKIIVATAYLESKYLLIAVELGLIKYLIKPITEDILLPVLKMCSESFEQKNNIFMISEHYSFDTFNKTLFKDKTQVELSKKEVLFLDLLIKNYTRVVTYEEFNTAVWNGDMSDDAMRSIVKELRRKISKDSLKNISKMGYQIQTIVD